MTISWATILSVMTFGLIGVPHLTYLALLRGLAVEERGDPGPLVLAVLHDGRLEDLVLRVAPYPALDHHARHLGGLFESGPARKTGKCPTKSGILPLTDEKRRSSSESDARFSAVDF